MARLDGELDALLELSNAKAALLIDKEGHMVTRRGEAAAQGSMDSIAALVATELSGDLRLAKRVAPPPCPDTDRLAALARTGWIDGHFPAAAAGLARIAWAAPISVPAPGVGGTAFEGGGAGGR